MSAREEYIARLRNLADLGGWINSEQRVFGDARVSGNARMSGNARVSW